jgi:hypothetical protein
MLQASRWHELRGAERIETIEERICFALKSAVALDIFGTSAPPLFTVIPFFAVTLLICR